MDPEELLASAIEQLQVAAKQMKQQHSMEAKMWQKKAQELQSVVESLQSQLRDAQKENTQLRLAFDETTKEAEHLRTMNDSLARSLQEKEQVIAKFVSLNQSLKGLLDDQPQTATRLQSTSTFDVPQHEAPVSRLSFAKEDSRSRFQPHRTPPSQPPLTPESQRAKPASQGSMFIRAAKSELTYSDFNQMISEINMYNKHEQSREETIANVRKLLCPAHRTLFEQFLPMIGGN
jgi:Rad3-related DNA helicase